MKGVTLVSRYCTQVRFHGNQGRNFTVRDPVIYNVANVTLGFGSPGLSVEVAL